MIYRSFDMTEGSYKVTQAWAKELATRPSATFAFVPEFFLGDPEGFLKGGTVARFGYEWGVGLTVFILDARLEHGMFMATMRMATEEERGDWEAWAGWDAWTAWDKESREKGEP